MARTLYPKYLFHKSSGQAYTYHRQIDSPDHRIYLGKYGTPASYEKLQEIVNRLDLGLKPQPPAPLKLSAQPSIGELIVAYKEHAKVYYRREDGTLAREYEDMRWSLAVLHGHHAGVLGADYGPRMLKELRLTLVRQGYARTYVNKTVARIKRFFRWACSEEFVPATVLYGVDSVQGLRRGELGAYEKGPVRPAPPLAVESLLPYVSPVIGDMLQTQYLCAMRPFEVCIMRPCDIERRGDIWLYTPETHKTQRLGKTLVKAIPAAAQRVLLPRLDREPTAYLFPPSEALQWLYANRRTADRPRTTKRYPSEVKRLAELKAARHAAPNLRPVREHYDSDSYYHGMRYGFRRAEAAGVHLPKFCPLQLRHSIVSYISSRLGQQKAQRYAGHDSLDTTSIYTEKDVAEMVDVARQLDAIWAAAS